MEGDLGAKRFDREGGSFVSAVYLPLGRADRKHLPRELVGWWEQKKGWERKWMGNIICGGDTSSILHPSNTFTFFFSSATRPTSFSSPKIYVCRRASYISYFFDNLRLDGAIKGWRNSGEIGKYLKSGRTGDKLDGRDFR